MNYTRNLCYIYAKKLPCSVSKQSKGAVIYYFKISLDSGEFSAREILASRAVFSQSKLKFISANQIPPKLRRIFRRGNSRGRSGFLSI